MKLVIYPAVEPERLAKILAVAPDATVANMETPEAAVSEMADADAFFGKRQPSRNPWHLCEGPRPYACAG